MKRILAITTAALMSTAIAGTAVAQGVGVGVDTGVEAGASAGTGAGAGADIETDVEAGAETEMETDPGTTGAIGAGANVGAVVSAINSGQLGTAEIESATDIGMVNVVRIDEMPGGEEQQAIDQAVDERQAEIEELRAAIEAHSDIYGELEAQGVSAGDVVAADVEADGSVTVYVR